MGPAIAPQVITAVATFAVAALGIAATIWTNRQNNRKTDNRRAEDQRREDRLRFHESRLACANATLASVTAINRKIANEISTAPHVPAARRALIRAEEEQFFTAYASVRLLLSDQIRELASDCKDTVSRVLDASDKSEQEKAVASFHEAQRKLTEALRAEFVVRT
jgi:hypothetical protein